MKGTFYLISILVLIVSCHKGESVDLIIHNANVHTMTDEQDKIEAIAIKDGKIVEERFFYSM